jgi:hypothetical protein
MFSIPLITMQADPADADEDAIVKMVGYKRYRGIEVLMFLVYLCTAGAAWLVGYWKPDWLLKVTCYVVPLPFAQYVFVTRESGGTDVEFVESVAVSTPGELGHDVMPFDSEDTGDVSLLLSHNRSEPSETITFFMHRNIRFIYDDRSNLFRRVVAFDSRTTIQKLHAVSQNPPLAGDARNFNYALYGKNNIDVPIKPYFTIFVQEVLDPFYIFQLFAVLLWFYEFYIYYAICIVVISGVSIIINLRETRRNLTNLHNMVKFIGTARFCASGLASNDNQVRVVDSTELLPGDIVDIPAEGMVLSFDAVLIQGGVVVNESMLTGLFSFFIFSSDLAR